jgi:ubiquinone/menaquinone biosynthesis C-methylase UbiE
MVMGFYPALKYRILTPYYDWFINLTMPENEVKNRVISLADLNVYDSVLDFGSGTGTLAKICLELFPNVAVIGLEVDPEMIELANTREINGLKSILYDGKTIPFPDDYFDKVFSSWVFHHLTREEKVNAFKEIRRVLKPAGVFVLADWGEPSNWIQRFLFFILQVFDTFNHTLDNVNGKLPSIIEDSGFKNVKPEGHRNTVFGTLRYWLCS